MEFHTDLLPRRGCAIDRHRLVTLEDHVLSGGFGSAVLEELNRLGIATPVVRVGWPDQFIEHVNIEALRAKYGVSVEAALAKVRPVLGLDAKEAAVKVKTTVEFRATPVAPLAGTTETTEGWALARGRTVAV